MAKGKEVAVHTPQLPTNWEDRLRQDSARAKAAVADIGIGQFMSTKSGVLSYQGTPVPGNKMRAVILGDLRVNAYYPGAYDPDSPASPVCWAFGKADEVKQMAPPEDAPERQAESCGECPQNKFGSAETGRGKACKNGIRLGLIHADSLRSPAELKDSTMAILGIPPTSLPSWATYINTLGAMGLPAYAVVTEISIVPDPKTQFKLTFTLVEKLKDKKVLGAVFAKHDEAEAALDFPFTPTEERAPARSAARGARPTAKPAARAAAPAGALAKVKF